MVLYTAPKVALYNRLHSFHSFRLTPAQGFAPRPQPPRRTAMPGQRGTEKRQRKWAIPARFTDEELAEVDKKAAASGRSRSAFLRDSALGRVIKSREDMQITADLLKISNQIRSLGGLVKHQFTESGGQYGAESARVLREIAAAISRLNREEDRL